MLVQVVDKDVFVLNIVVSGPPEGIILILNKIIKKKITYIVCLLVSLVVELLAFLVN